MKKSIRWLLVLCIAAIAGVFLLQFFWIQNYYYVNRAAFEKEVNLAFDDAVKKDFSLRCDAIENLIFHKLLDTNELVISNLYNKQRLTTLLTIVNKHNLKDKSYFHSDGLDYQVAEKDMGPAKIKLARFLAHIIRKQDLESHSVYYRTQNLGAYINNLVKKYDFDTVRLRPVFNRMLSERDINIPYVFYTRSNDSTYNKSDFKPSLLAKYPVITRAFLTYKRNSKQNYIRAMFTSPFGYIITKMGMLFLGSLLLILIIGFSLFYLLRSLLTERKLSLIKNDFISNITHELKTPVATVYAAVESLADFDVLKDPEKTQRYLAHAKNELQRLSVLIDTVLNSTLYESGQFNVNPERFNVDELLRDSINNYKLTSKHVTINYNNKSTVNFIYADKMLFRQALDNIVDNAIKYSNANVVIDIDCSINNKFFLIAIKDNGIGVLKENIPHLFEKFYREPSGNKHKVKGYGLGLNYVKSIMEYHKGWYRMESEYGRGSKMILGWPI